MNEEQAALPISATPQALNPVTVVEARCPAVFRVTPASGGGATVAPEIKLARPGVVLMPTMKTREDGELARSQPLALVQPDAAPAARTVELEIRSIPNCVLHADHTIADSARFIRLPISGDVEEEPSVDDTSVDEDAPAEPEQSDIDDHYSSVNYLDSFEQSNDLSFGPTADEALLFNVAYSALPGYHKEELRRSPIAAPTGPYLGALLGSQRQTLYRYRSRREIWLRLLNRDPDQQTIAEDVALFTLPPVLFASSVQAPLRLFVVRKRDTGSSPGNFDVVGTLADIARQVQIPLTLLEGDETGEDVWAQDAVHLGHLVTPDEVLHVVVQTPRRGHGSLGNPGVEAVVASYLPDGETGIFAELFKDIPTNKLMDGGGNLVATPPVPNATQAHLDDDAGPDVCAHPEAPYGKILLGDGGPQGSGRPTKEVWRFLESQQVQPVVRIDTSWLHVGHTDEIVNFVPAYGTCGVTSCGGAGFAVLFASPDLAVRVLQRVRAEHGEEDARVVRGLRSKNSSINFSAPGDAAPLPAYRLVDDDAERPVDRAAHTWARKLDHIRQRLVATLALNGDGRDILAVPVLFTPANAKVGAQFPDMVNMVALGSTILLPKPWGPRLTVAAARKVLVGLERITEGMVDAAQLGDHAAELFWAAPGMEAQEVREAFTRGGATSVETIANAGDDHVVGWHALPDGLDAVPKGWTLYKITQTSVDIFEAYIRVRFRPLGLTPVFVDDWVWYHIGGGELHCGTKVRRQPHQVAAKDVWWQRTDYHDVVDTW
ncbi:protein-arginine deiminase family protein [Sorangium sp. So ce394]|uniref:protein-arginine deiminase family protein n=1 Tax=Sorangium sp. So ce394 TaxID=3133310 RepID=UPI003F5BED9B